MGVGSHDLGVGVVDLAVAGRHALEEGGAGEFRPGEQEPGVQLGAGLELDPGQLLAGQEDREQAQPAVVLLDHLARRARAGEEAGAEMGQLGLQGGPGDEPGVPVVAQGSRPRRAGVVGRGAGPDQRVVEEPVEVASTEGPPRLAGHEPEHHGQDDELGDAHHGGDEALAPRGVVDALDGTRRGGVPEDEVVEARGDEREAQGHGDGEGDEQPPGEAGEAPVEQARTSGSGHAGRVGQPLDAVLPRRRGRGSR